MSSATLKADGQMDSRQAFMARIKEIWVGHGRTADSWDRLHDWDDFYRMGYRAETAGEAYRYAMRCE